MVNDVAGDVDTRTPPDPPKPPDDESKVSHLLLRLRSIIELERASRRQVCMLFIFCVFCWFLFKKKF